ncbi:hypothetical protein ERO13_A05G117533v2 [Gossypium hirsutum]|nr:hypothetical protein ERO13_A05G117533v2 [Gossypium hirsutum]
MQKITTATQSNAVPYKALKCNVIWSVYMRIVMDIDHKIQSVEDRLLNFVYGVTNLKSLKTKIFRHIQRR